MTLTLTFALIAVVTIAAAVAAMSLRNLVHCALSLTVAFAGLATAYVQLGAQFVGFAQVLVYVGAVAILIVFAILLTRGSETVPQNIWSPGWLTGIAAAVAVFGVLAYAISRSFVSQRPPPPAPEATVRQIGDAMMHQFILPLEVVGLLLTAALIGAVIIAMRDEPSSRIEDGGSKMEKGAGPSSILHPPSSQGTHS